MKFRRFWLFALLSVLFIVSSAVPLLSRNAPVSPGYKEPVPVPLPSKMREWRYIVIHHSGASSGNEAIIQEGHLRRGMENGMAYHFLIGNGSKGLGDGTIAEGRRWKYQLQGGHCHQEYLNENGIGICLVGNFDRGKITTKQSSALVQLILRLQKEFQIPEEQIHGHGHYYGEDSDCPGRSFPWTNFWQNLHAAFEDQVTNTVEISMVQDE
jgi:N-acetyl-anhydromuramyl-L-alanine amidase AmpD